MKQLDLIVVDVGNSACKVGEVQAELLAMKESAANAAESVAAAPALELVS